MIRFNEADSNNWKSKWQFILCCFSYISGTTLISTFPYLCDQSGGGAIVIPYILILFICAVPLIFLDTMIGQFRKASFMSVYNLYPILKGAGYGQILCLSIYTAFYAMNVVFPLRYLYDILKDTESMDFSWGWCNNPWNTMHCIEGIEEKPPSFINFTEVTNGTLRTAFSEYFYIHILEWSPDFKLLGSIVWPLFTCLAITWALVFLFIVRGVKSLRHIIYVTSILKYFLLILTYTHITDITGATEGFKYFVQPEYSRLLDVKLWVTAGAHIYLSLGFGNGVLINLSSYNNMYNNTALDSILLPLFLLAINTMGAYNLNAIIGAFGVKAGLKTTQITRDHYQLFYIILPKAIYFLSNTKVWAVGLYFMLFLFAFDCMAVLMHVLMTAVWDVLPKANPKNRKFKVLIIFLACLILFLLSLPLVTTGGISYLHHFNSARLYLIPVFFFCLLENILISYIYKVKNFIYDYIFIFGEGGYYYRTAWFFITPILTMFLLITFIHHKIMKTLCEPTIPIEYCQLNWLTVIIPIICLFIYILFVLCKIRSLRKENYKFYFKSFDWYPPQEKSEYNKFLYVVHSGISFSRKTVTFHSRQAEDETKTSKELSYHRLSQYSTTSQNKMSYLSTQDITESSMRMKPVRFKKEHRASEYSIVEIEEEDIEPTSLSKKRIKSSIKKVSKK